MKITIGIGNEVRESTVQLSQMVRCMLLIAPRLRLPYLPMRPPQNDAFAETSGILAGTFRRMNNMAQRQGCRWLWYILFLVFVFWFFIIVWWFRR